jgi:hypothetical protein
MKNCDNHGGITLLGACYKLYAKILARLIGPDEKLDSENDDFTHTHTLCGKNSTEEKRREFIL